MLNKIVDIWAVLMVLSIVIYSFTGLHFWVPVEWDPGRAATLFIVHVVPIFFSGLRRLF